MKTALIIHGHFYQPPREDPFTGIYPIQSSAAPYSDWNEAVFKTCYEPNAYSRYLSWDGRIETIYNNYENISFNFGPTLLRWLDEKHPDFIRKLIEADKESIRKWGHSNIIAQTYNHAILPLESRENKKIQVLWAIEDYYRRFGHFPEGFWCAECAINEETVDVLAECGIKFVILSPWQVKAINGVDLEGHPAPYNRPFILKGEERTISAFFYNGDFASGISFGHLLRDADALYKNITSYKNRIEADKGEPPALLSWATDGEIYGHHEPFGDMALAALCKKVADGEDFYLTNYAAYLEENPPEEIATLYLGEDGLGSSWSCSHGVKRWYTDCGCHTGGDESWNQKWRDPLRKAFKNLEIKAREIYKKEIQKIFGSSFNTEEMLISYGKVLSERISPEDFVRAYAQAQNITVDERDISKVLKLLNAIKNVFFSFTSCGWFFNDITGIEPAQNIKYAFFAAETLKEFTNEPLTDNLLKDLDKAQSNISGTGKTIAKELLTEEPAEIKACEMFALRKRLHAKQTSFSKHSGIFTLLNIKDNVYTIKNRQTLEVNLFECKEKANYKNSYFQLLFKNTKTRAEYATNLSKVSLNMIKEIDGVLDHDIVSNYTPKNLQSLSASLKKFLLLSQLRTDAIKQAKIKGNIILFIKALYSDAFYSEELSSEFRLFFISNIVKLVNLIGNKDEKSMIENFFNMKINDFNRELNENTLTDSKVDSYLNALETARSNGISPNLTDLQNTIWGLISRSQSNTLSEETFNKMKLYLNFN